MIKQSNETVKLLNDLRNNYETEILEKGKQVQLSIIIPFCHKRKLSFVSGMGTWFFWDDLKRMSVDQDTLPKYITNLLDTYTCNSFCFGEYVPSYSSAISEQ